MSKELVISGAYLGLVLVAAGITHFVSLKYGAPIGPGIVLFVLTLPSSLIVLVPPLDALEGEALTAFLVGCGALQAGALWLWLR
ncbi:SCO4225 family membrane protein [Thermoactinospora rubra]|uniref:SCO4225 family membrane protein n=1 Tax=Thermoactinospora rubra TaxID=1088767 RepID=UPI000A10F3B6|nr:hypothetical protein [Thermoactinospora rubra]